MNTNLMSFSFNNRRTTRGFRLSLPLLLSMLALLLVCSIAPAFAQDAASIIQSKTSTAYNLVYTAVYGLMGIALLVCFLGALFGRMEWSRFGLVCAGIVGCGAITVIIQTFS